MTRPQTQAKVLLVDDSWYMQALVRDALEPLGLHVIYGENGARAIDIYREELPDVVLMDIVLPDLDGITVISQIRELHPAAQIAVVSGLLNDQTRQRARELGVESLVAKPFTSGELREAVQSMLPETGKAAYELQAAG